MRFRKRWIPIQSLLVGALLMGPAAAVAEDSARPAAKPLRAREVLLSLDANRPDETWVHSHIHFSVKRGVEYRDRFALGHKDVALKVWGPVVKSRPGLGLELRGLSIGEHQLELRAYGNLRKQGLHVELHF